MCVCVCVLLISPAYAYRCISLASTTPTAPSTPTTPTIPTHPHPTPRRPPQPLDRILPLGPLRKVIDTLFSIQNLYARPTTNYLDPTESAKDFIEDFELRYGQDRPLFQPWSYSRVSQ